MTVSHADFWLNSTLEMSQGDKRNELECFTALVVESSSFRWTRVLVAWSARPDMCYWETTRTPKYQREEYWKGGGMLHENLETQPMIRKPLPLLNIVGKMSPKHTTVLFLQLANIVQTGNFDLTSVKIWANQARHIQVP